ncbi:DgyrCDS13610 [Dimorphilus gyrociliatus]|uniref:DgyrCDS13610 n=1 Tax=Dimorphilus gyrociliatus TaxID=2664684 RepID=A0A7I8WB43_9ANNE|nr:DgyrCDS13610 [Dimorphilus gyrociliatus]
MGQLEHERNALVGSRKTWLRLFYNFTQETTFHGVRFITSSTPWFIRRILWFLSCSTALGIFAWFVNDRLSHFRDKPRSVNVEVIFTRSVDFPDITICNQNSFRTSETHEIGLYDTVEATFEKGLQSEPFDFVPGKILKGIGPPVAQYENVTARVCLALCSSQQHSSQCCAVMFNTFSKTCYITPMSDRNDGIKVIDSINTNFYRRKTCDVKTNYTCDFEQNVCGLVNKSATRELTWHRIMAKTSFSVSSFDRTSMNSSGYIVRAYSSFSQKQSSAQLVSTFISAGDNTCIKFYYQLRSGVLSVKTQLRSENFNLIWQRKGIQVWQWYKGYKKLPQGFYRVVLEASSSGRGEVDVSLDDITISSCLSREDIVCAEDPFATDYAGVQTKSISGRECQPWSSISSYLLATFLKPWGSESENSSLVELGSYCRNPNFDLNGPWCVTDVNSMTIEYCKIPSCQCPEDSFTCNNGNCTSLHLRCNGENDCGDNSDELSEYCDKQMSLECEFEDWNCGYDTSESVTADWKIVSSVGRSSYYSIVNGRKNDKVVLVSPAFKLSTDSCIYMDLKLTPLVPVSLSLRQAKYKDLSRNYLCSLEKNDTNWQASFIDIPKGNFHLVLDTLPTINFELAIDNITLYGQNCNNTMEEAIRIKNLKIERLKQIEIEIEKAKQEYVEEILRRRATTPSYNYTINGTETNVTSESRTTTTPLISDSTVSVSHPTTNNLTINVTTDPYHGLINETWLRETRLNITNRLLADVPKAIPFGERFCNKMECINCLEDLKYEGFNVSLTNETKCNSTCNLSPTCLCDYKFRSSHSQISWVIRREILSRPDSRKINSTENSTNVDLTPIYRYFTSLALPKKRYTTGTVDFILPYRDFPEESCLQFYYVIYNIDVVAQKIDGSFHLLTLTHDQYVPVRHLAKVKLPIGYYRIEFRVRLSSLPGLENVRLDTFKISPGKCPWTGDEPNVNCTFSNNDWCGYEDISEGSIRWRRSQDDQKDDTEGFYVKTTGRADSIWQSGRILSPWFNSTSYKIKINNVKPTMPTDDGTTSSNSTGNTTSSNTTITTVPFETTTAAIQSTTKSGNPTRFGRDVSHVNRSTFDTTIASSTPQEDQFFIINQSCVTFSYFTQLNGQDGRSTFSVILINETDTRELGWRLHNTGENEWHTGQFEIGVGRFRLEFQLTGYNTRGGIDDVRVLHGPCPSVFQCKEQTYACTSSKTCIPNLKVCDGLPNCNEAVDEDCPGNNQTTTKTEIVIEQDIEIGAGGRGQMDELFNSLETIYKRTAHQKDDMIYSCFFEGTPCSQENFTRVLTDYGQCYTFMGKNQSEWLTDKTGSRFGLSLTINIEQYEYMIGPHSDAGIKVFMHAKNEIPEVRDLGFAIPPGSHALVGIRKQITENLRAPHGDCDDRPLQFYPAYYHSSCRRECETLLTNKECGCVDAYMPRANGADFLPTCNLTGYFKCVIPFIGSPDAVSATCNCPKPCRQVVFEPFLSNAALSKLSVQQLLSNDLKPLKRKFTRAYETTQRVSTKTFIDDISQLNQVLSDYIQFTQLTGQYLENLDESSFNKVWISAKRLITLFEHDEGKYLEDIDSRVIEYNNIYEKGDVVLESQAVELKIALLEVQQYLEFYNTTPEEPAYSLFKTAIATAVTKGERVIQTLNVIYERKWQNENSFDDIRIAWNTPSEKRNCSDKVIDLSEALFGVQILLQRIDSPDFQLNNSNGNIINQFKNNVTSFLSLSDNVESCLTEYIDAMKALSTFSKDSVTELKGLIENQENFLIDSSFDYDKEIEAVNSFLNDLNETTQNYIHYRISKGKMLELFGNADNGQGMLEQIRLFKDKILQKVTSPLQNRISQIESEVKEKYKQMLSLTAKTESFFKSGYYYSTAEKMIIWKGIAPNFENPTNIKQEGKELVNIWIRGTPIDVFQKSKGNAFIESAISSFMDQLDKILEDFEAQIKSKTNILENNVNTLATQYQVYTQKIEINDQFVLENFLNIDFYFSQLKEQTITQVEDYKIIQFFSDIGGFMGLLLGGSVLSVCEVIDLILYNFALKMFHRQNKNKKSQKQVQSTNSKEALNESLQANVENEKGLKNDGQSV